jgi:hypothetical protein
MLSVLQEAGIDTIDIDYRETSVETAIQQDRRLTAEQKERLLADYRAYVGRSGTGAQARHVPMQER